MRLTNRVTISIPSLQKLFLQQKRCLATNPSLQKSNLAGILVFSTVSLTAAGLGYWQLQRYLKFFSRTCLIALHIFVLRYDWKVGYLQEMKDRASGEPVPVRTTSEFHRILPGQKVVLEGNYVHDKGIY